MAISDIMYNDIYKMINYMNSHGTILFRNIKK